MKKGLKSLFFSVILSLLLPLGIHNSSGYSAQDDDPPQLYLPLITWASHPSPRVNIPDMDEINFSTSAIFWLGRVTPEENYADVRVGYSSDRLWFRVSIIDRRLWYKPDPSESDLTQWDAVSLYLDLDAGSINLDNGSAYRLIAQLNWWEPREEYQAAYRGSSSGWEKIPLTFTTQSNWYGFPAPNDEKDDRGWRVTYSIPFSSLGLTGAPAPGTHWRLAVQIHDRDDRSGTPIEVQTWPLLVESHTPKTWGLMSFGLPVFSPPENTPTQTISLRNGLNGIEVLDGVVGGNTNCGNGLDYWSEWGNLVYPGIREVNVQNQGNTDDWPCFSKYYITFPMDSLPPGKVIISSTLTLHQLGQATGFPSDPTVAENSLIQVFQLGEDWDPATLSWNNGPLPLEYASQAWVGSITMADLGIARSWDVSRVTSQAYLTNQPLRLVLYSADSYGPHGKYFFSSSSTDNNGAFRPQLKIIIGNP